jgi:hypothetical protein
MESLPEAKPALEQWVSIGMELMTIPAGLHRTRKWRGNIIGLMVHARPGMMSACSDTFSPLTHEMFPPWLQKAH